MNSNKSFEIDEIITDKEEMDIIEFDEITDEVVNHFTLKVMENGTLWTKLGKLLCIIPSDFKESWTNEFADFFSHFRLTVEPGEVVVHLYCSNEAFGACSDIDLTKPVKEIRLSTSQFFGQKSEKDHTPQKEI